MNDENFEALLDRYQRGETSVSENDEVEKWLLEIEPKHTQWKSLQQDERELWINDLRNAVRNSIKPAEPVPSAAIRLQLWKTIAKVAAVIAVAALIAVNWTSISHIFYPQQQFALQTNSRQIKKILLPDGSMVWINSSSKIEYPKSFDGKTRTVFLTGEAYFDVRHDDAKPFIVRTGDITTTVLGTAFNINASNATDKIIVTVTRGKVSVSDKHHLLAYITPNQQLIYNVSQQDNKKLAINAQKIISWQNDLYFDDVTFEEAAKQLEKRFHINIAFENENMKACRFSGTAMGNKTLDEILNSICAINQANYERKENNLILISGNGCK